MTSHRTCQHPATAAARARCRATRSAHANPLIAGNPPATAVKARRERVTEENRLDIARGVSERYGITWPTDEERAASLTKVWCTTCHLLHDASDACSGTARRATSPTHAAARHVADPHDVGARKAESAREAASSLPTFDNARRLAADIPEGRYAVRGTDDVIKFYKIDKPTDGKWAGFVFLKVQASEEFYPIKSPAQQMNVFSAILEAGVRESFALYGHTLGHCGVCGRTLTDAESIAAGIGPKCAARLGW